MNLKNKRKKRERGIYGEMGTERERASDRRENERDGGKGRETEGEGYKRERDGDRESECQRDTDREQGREGEGEGLAPFHSSEVYNFTFSLDIVDGIEFKGCWETLGGERRREKEG